MKKAILLASILSIVSCSRNNDEEIATPSSIIGKWEATHIIHTETSGNVDNISLKDCGNDVYEFKSDGKYVLTERIEDNGECTTGTPLENNYQYNPETKILSLGDYGYQAQVYTLTATELVFEKENADTDGDGKPDSRVLYLKRVN